MAIKIIFIVFLISIKTLGYNKSNPDTQVFSKFEYGFISILHHKLQRGADGTNFDYVKNGGQNILFPTWRIEAGLKPNHKHIMSLLYQPISLETEVVLKNEFKIDSILFKENTNLLSCYDFSFYRFNYYYLTNNFISTKIWVGLGLQIRNANIKLRNRTGEQAYQTSSLGPVPLFSVLLENSLNSNISIQSKISGFANPFKTLSENRNESNGWIYELEIQPHLNINNGWKYFGNLRLLGGGYVGKLEQQTNTNRPKNTLATASLTVGIQKES